jgi:hypothetical protein
VLLHPLLLWPAAKDEEGVTRSAVTRSAVRRSSEEAKDNKDRVEDKDKVADSAAENE